MSNAELPGPFDEVEENRMPLLEHLRELRTRVIRATAGLLFGMAVSMFFAEDLYAWLTAPFLVALEESGVKGGLSIVHSPFEGFYTYLRVGFVGGTIIAMPIIAWQLWQFIAPGLYKTERKVVLPLTVSSTFLFTFGAGFAYYAIFPIAFPFFLGVIKADANLSIDGYLTAVVRIMVAFGVCFQLPVATWFAARLGLIHHRDMIEGFRYAVVVMFVVSAIITPPDPLTQVMLALPLIALYGFSIIIAWMFTTKPLEGY